MADDVPKSDTRILVVDDDPAIRNMLRLTLLDEGYTVVTAADGAEALARVDDSAPHLILLDLMMPVMDGWETYRHLTAEGRSHPPIMVITAGQFSDRARRELREVAEVINKPFDLDHLLGAVEAHLRRSRNGHGPPPGATA
jgi:DNA-binding response OmpR family regulator